MKQENRFRLWHIPVLALLILATLLILRNQEQSQIPFQIEEGAIFGTVYHVQYQHGESLQKEILNCLQSVDSSLSMFNKQSTVSKINSGEDLHTDSMFEMVFQCATAISEVTNGSFDVTVAPLVNAWGFGFKHGQWPDTASVDSLRQFVGWQKVSIQDHKVEKDDARIILDFSAIAKGFGVDQVASLLRSHGIDNFMIEIGGEIVSHGHNPKGEPWRIGINKPDEEKEGITSELQDIIEMNDCAIATSGNYRNFYVRDGKRVAHTIDPHSGYPVQHSILSSTVLAPTCAMADGFATAFMVMGLDSAKAVLQKQKELQAYFILSADDGKYDIWCTPNFRQLILNNK
ncbi:MAG: FAD:protein FMN transferase [Bacteroidaceae bacterium]